MFDLDAEMNTAQVVESAAEEGPIDLDDGPIDIDAEMEAEDAGTTNIFSSGQYVVKNVDEEEMKQGESGVA